VAAPDLAAAISRALGRAVPAARVLAAGSSIVPKEIVLRSAVCRHRIDRAKAFSVPPAGQVLGQTSQAARALEAPRALAPAAGQRKDNSTIFSIWAAPVRGPRSNGLRLFQDESPVARRTTFCRTVPPRVRRSLVVRRDRARATWRALVDQDGPEVVILVQGDLAKVCVPVI